MSSPDELSQRDFAKVLGISTRQVRNLEDRGLPHRSEGRRKWYPVPEAVQWYVDFKVEAALKDVEVPDREAAKTRRERARAKLEEIKLARKQGKLTTKEAMREAHGAALDLIGRTLRNWPGRWGAQLGYDDPRKGEARLREMVDELLDRLSGRVADALELGGADPELPEDVPSRRWLVKAGVETVTQLLEVHADDAGGGLRSLPGIGEKRAEEIEDWIREERRSGDDGPGGPLGRRRGA